VRNWAFLLLLAACEKAAEDPVAPPVVDGVSPDLLMSRPQVDRGMEKFKTPTAIVFSSGT